MKKVVPKTNVSANKQWYENNRDLLEAEIVAMNDFKTDARFYFMDDGRMYWLVRFCPVVAGRKTRTYTLALVYDEDHPKLRYGSSVKAYPLSPTIDELQQMINRMPNVSPKNIPHTLVDSRGERYLCSADTSNIKTDMKNGGVTSAATSLRFAMRWINIFELGLIDPETWAKFQRHGEI